MRKRSSCQSGVVKTPAIAALADATRLSRAQVHGVIEVLAQLEPQRLTDFAERDELDELDDDARMLIMQRAPRYLVVRILERWHPDLALVEAARAAHGAFVELVLYCEGQGWRDLAIDLASQLEASEVDYLTEQWARDHGAVPASLRIALVHAALADRAPRPNVTELSNWERQELINQLAAEERRRASSVAHSRTSARALGTARPERRRRAARPPDPARFGGATHRRGPHSVPAHSDRRQTPRRRRSDGGGAPHTRGRPGATLATPAADRPRGPQPSRPGRRLEARRTVPHQLG